MHSSFTISFRFVFSLVWIGIWLLGTSAGMGPVTRTHTNMLTGPPILSALPAEASLLQNVDQSPSQTRRAASSFQKLKEARKNSQLKQKLLWQKGKTQRGDATTDKSLVTVLIGLALIAGAILGGIWIGWSLIYPLALGLSVLILLWMIRRLVWLSKKDKSQLG